MSALFRHRRACLDCPDLTREFSLTTRAARRAFSARRARSDAPYLHGGFAWLVAAVASLAVVVWFLLTELL